MGVTCTFGAPIGGVLFAIEVSTSTFTVSNLWKSFFAATITVYCFKSAGMLEKAAMFRADASYFYSGIAPVGISNELPLFIVLGILCGIIGSFYIEFQRCVNTTKASYSHYFIVKNPLVYTSCISLLVLNTTYFLRTNISTEKSIINSMINIDENLAKRNITVDDYDLYLKSKFGYNRIIMDDPDQWVYYDGYLLLFFIQKFVFTALTLSCEIPGGIFTPTIALGAVVGQLYVSAVIRFLAAYNIHNFIKCK